MDSVTSIAVAVDVVLGAVELYETAPLSTRFNVHTDGNAETAEVSRAVLSRRGKAVQLSTDHKPATERARVVQAGGSVCGEGLLNGKPVLAHFSSPCDVYRCKSAGWHASVAALNDYFDP